MMTRWTRSKKQEGQEGQEGLDIIREFNKLMKSSITGPNCIDPALCNADCCHIHIDIPKFLAEYYLNKGLATKDCFIRGDVFSFALAVTRSNAKCVFYDKDLNGCSLHSSGMKPPQCWIYPTGFSNEPGEEKRFAPDGSITCKKAGGWKVTDLESAKKAELIFKRYVEICISEFIDQNSEDNISNRLKKMFDSLSERIRSGEKLPPNKIAGIVDKWDTFDFLQAEGFSFSMKKFCKANPDCKQEFMECSGLCMQILPILFSKIEQLLDNFIKKNGPKREYSFFELNATD